MYGQKYLKTLFRFQIFFLKYKNDNCFRALLEGIKEMIVNTVIPMIIREIEDQEIRITGLWDNRDLPMITEKDFASVDPLQILPINGVDCFVRFYGDEGTVLMKSNLYDLRFRDCQKVKTYMYIFFSISYSVCNFLCIKLKTTIS